MSENKWRTIWEKRTADFDILQGDDFEKIVLELKRCNGFDVVGEGLTFDSILQQYSSIKDNLSANEVRNIKGHKGGDLTKTIKSVYEVGGGSGANLFLFERDGIHCGMIDYSESLVEIAKCVLRATDVVYGEAIDINIEPQYDAVLANSVFSYFPDKEYAYQVLEKMYKKAERSIGMIDIHDMDKEADFLAYRKKTIQDYEERYKDLPKLFYPKSFFEDFAKEHGMEIKFESSVIDGYWNNNFVFNCYMYKCQSDYCG